MGRNREDGVHRPVGLGEPQTLTRAVTTFGQLSLVSRNDARGAKSAQSCYAVV